MKEIEKTIITTFLLPLTLTGISQTNQNHVKTIVYLDEGKMDSIVNYQYYDGLGRLSETATNGLGMSGKFIYTMTTYDQNEREKKKYQPVAGGTTIEYKSEAAIKALSNSTYSNDRYGYSEIQYDALDRMTYNLGAGEEWHVNEKKKQWTYGINITNSVKQYTASNDNSSSVSQSGYYTKGLLDKEKKTDEDGKTIEIYRDFLGHTVLERRAGNNDTYYVYNNRGLLRFVLSPMYQNIANLDYYAYEYRYDSKGRCVWKKLPNCEYIQYWYDKHDRLAYMQDGNLRLKGKYRFFLYDKYGRQALQGICININTSTSYQATVTFTSSTTGLMETGYTMDYPYNHGTLQLELASYYDNYGFVNTLFCGSKITFLTKLGAANATGLPTGNIVSTSNGGKLFVATYYDEKGQVIDERRSVPDGTVSTQTQYTFTGKLASINKSISCRGASYSLIYNNEYYNANDQMKKTTLKYCNSEPVVINEYEYNDLGQLKKLKRGGMDNASYSYDIQGHLTSITNPIYSEGLMYAQGGKYNGSIAFLFSTGEESIPYYYGFTYDGLNRLTTAYYSSQDFSNQNYYDETITYDSNGNALTLKRSGLKDNGSHGVIDDLSMTYLGNQLVGVSDAVSGPNYSGAFHFVDNYSINSMTYDPNGNLTQDLDRKISQIEYNLLNLPKKITMQSSGTISYNYDALGRRHSKSYYLIGNSGSSGGQYDYVDDIVFHNGAIEQVRFDGGYISFTSDGTPHYHYYHKDHFGSVRVVTDAGGNVEQRRSYYPFGASFKESATTDGNRLKFSGKELERLHALNDYDFGARTYVPTIGRFTQIDPLCEKYYSVSPYAYCANNPENSIDPDGKVVIPILFSFVNGRGNAIGVVNSQTKRFGRAMKKFANTNYGNDLISSFTHKGFLMYGSKGNGKYSNYILSIEQYNYDNPNEQFLNMGNSIGSFSIEEDHGTLNFVLKIDVANLTEDEMVVILTHELALHGSKIPQIVEAYKEGGFEKVNRLYKDRDKEKEHVELKSNNVKYQGVKNYLNVKDELVEKFPDLEGLFRQDILGK